MGSHNRYQFETVTGHMFLHFSHELWQNIFHQRWIQGWFPPLGSVINRSTAMEKLPFFPEKCGMEQVWELNQQGGFETSSNSKHVSNEEKPILAKKYHLCKQQNKRGFKTCNVELNHVNKSIMMTWAQKQRIQSKPRILNIHQHQTDVKIWDEMGSC